MHSRMLALEDEGDSVEFEGGGEGRDFARRPIKRKIHKGVKGGTGGQGRTEEEKSGGVQAEGQQAGRLHESPVIINVRNRPLLTYPRWANVK